MPYNQCPQCGNNVPEGSKFCNHCGASMNPEPQQPNGNNADGSHKIRNGIIIAAIIAFIGIVVVRNLFYSGNSKPTPETTYVDDGDDSKYTDIFNRALEQNSLKIEGDRIAYAIPVKSEMGDSVNKIIGVTYLNDNTRSFYKIFTLTKRGSDWDINQNVIKYLDGRTLIFTPQDIRCAEVPSIDNISGKSYFYYAYVSLPKSTTDTDVTGTVSVALFDVETGQIARQIDFNGMLVRASDGTEQIMANTYTAGSSFLDTRLMEHAKGIGYLHLPSAEEIEAQKEEELRMMQERARADSLRAVEAAAKEEALDNGEEITTQVQEQDKNKPLFRAEDFSKKIQGGGYTVFMLKNGKVYAFNKAAGSTFEVPFGGSATDIGWEDSGTGVLNIRTAGGRFQYNLGTKTLRKTE